VLFRSDGGGILGMEKSPILWDWDRIPGMEKSPIQGGSMETKRHTDSTKAVLNL